MTPKQPDEPDIQIPVYTVPGIQVAWHESAEGVWTIRFAGTHEVEVREVPTEQGLMYESPAFRGRKPGDLKDSLRTAVLNSMNTAFRDEWDRRYPRLTGTERDTELARINAQTDYYERLLAEQEAATGGDPKVS